MAMTLTEQKERFLRLLVDYTFEGHRIPIYMHEPILQYVVEGIIPGAFLQGMIQKDMELALHHADMKNRWLLPVYFGFFYNHVPSPAWGSEKKMHEWANHRREAIESESRKEKAVSKD